MNDPADFEAFTTWAQGEINAMGQHAHTSGLVATEARGQMMWAVPQKAFIGKVWPEQDRRASYWVISGEGLPTDHIAADLATTPRDAARHFALKWQLESTHLSSLSGQARASRDDDAADVDWTEIGKTLERQAELLYDYVQRDDLWDDAAQRRFAELTSGGPPDS
ncbi:hypothetical protein BH24PSE2_BH24PSE2_02570 [soil metagenome]